VKSSGALAKRFFHPVGVEADVVVNQDVAKPCEPLPVQCRIDRLKSKLL
jgi:hypothetical protein